MVIRYRLGPSYVPPACTGIFADVPCPSGFAVNWIEDVYHRGIDTGCGGGNYCPTSPVSRALMAQMVARTWGYQMPFVTPNPGTDSYATTFNAANQLATVQTPSQTVSFSYDGDGLRFSKSTAAGTTYYVRDPQGQVIAEYSGTAALLAEYVDLDGQRLCTITHDANNVEHRVYYHADVLGTPVAETNETGQLVTKVQYDPFGEEVRPGAAADPHKFTGKELDSEIGLYYFGARYYDAHLGRFISGDPLAGSYSDPQSWNRYAFGRNNPLRFVDLTGMDWLEYTGQIITWYGGTAGDRSKPTATYPATSGYLGYQLPSLTGEHASRRSATPGEARLRRGSRGARGARAAGRAGGAAAGPPPG